MTLRERLDERRAAVCDRWLDAVLAEYGALTASRWRREQDAFANPVGHALRTGLPALLEAVLAGGDLAGAAEPLEPIVRIRSVQGLAPSRAVAFVFRLRDAIRGELGVEPAGAGEGAALAEIDGRIEQLALLAFDAYVRLRDQMHRIRQEELRRSVASIVRRWNGVLPEPSTDLVTLRVGGVEAPPSPPVARGQAPLPGPRAPGVIDPR
ncbi:MAG TPA: RsbRD N-terminal domain-containing protein [Anaeromyxobacteraceae bacterium]|nr:RsbRD N-terminal domain-containing protein [Anaeromyxobacteraceae bacterium]